MCFVKMTTSTETYTYLPTRSRHDALPIDCRSLESRASDCIGCGEQNCWQIEPTLPGEASGDYRQAASGELAAAAAAMMKQGALDATGERAARDAGWDRRR